MIVWSKKLYFSETIKKKHRKIIYAIKHKKRVPEVYCIIYALNKENLFELIPANELLFPVYQTREIHIVGLSGNKREAEELVTDMISEIYRETKGFQVREYFG